MKKTKPDFKFEKKWWKKGYWVIGVDEVGRGALAGPLHVGAVCFPAAQLRKVNLFGCELASRRTSGSVSPRSPSESEGSLRRSLARTSTSLTNLLSPENKKQIEKIGIDDSKRLSAKKRETLAKLIREQALAYSIGQISNREINRAGIVKATQKAMRKTIMRVMSKISNEVIKESENSSYLFSKLPIYHVLIDGFYLKYLNGIGLKNQTRIIKGDRKSISIAAASIIAKVERDQTMIKLHQKYPIYNFKRNKGYGTRQHIHAIKMHGKSGLHRDLYLRKII
ncbi:hypothetical protein A2774_04765 [Candidatus Roizmanbacteria bacterium RIFCSPHIGHO2_01_FULL_39_12c]|uniref:Ribonuclease n=1 Tax=Candidatus Roizmanbacteria bacterium RIFCSPHIGHO2_01_FULL_39_12c TaxID=1802031 RepID=A0A1F7GFB4_9BACT|nr:MAG: hypothetical protein A2774_04765 [Candidatus Roizmanbacteria bacterium RIFCSPHIGHO2_01_FULL_39_12c]OGK46241.1 MAG: hypothetical protein A2963_02120 [Candidatus Roizmanbacteria bacterium RIFCSPLOWO2_01_FULL_40_13]